MQKDKGMLTKALNDLVLSWPSIFGNKIDYSKILTSIEEHLERKRGKLLHDRFCDYSIHELDQLREMVKEAIKQPKKKKKRAKASRNSAEMML